VATAIVAWRDAAHAKAREQARSDVRRVRHLADEARFYATGIDPPGEAAPYFDAGRGEESALSALILADKWGPSVEKLPLAGEHDSLRTELADLCLLVAQLRLTAGVQQGPREFVSRITPLLDRADALRGRPTRGSMALRAQLYRLTRQSDEANLAQLAAEDPATPVTATDHFLDGERIRLGTTGDELGIPMLRDAGQRKRKSSAIQSAIERYRAALKIDPSHYWSRLQLGRCYLAEGRGPEAIESLATCIALRPDAAWGYTARGLALATLGRFDEARQDLDQALKLDAQCIPARLNRGAVALLRNQLDEASADFDTIVDSTGKQPVEALFYRGQVSIRRGDVAGATATLQQVTRERPQFVPAYVLLAQAQLLGGRTADALATLDGMIAMTRRRSSADDDARATRGHLLRLLAAQLPADRQRMALETALTELAAAARTDQASAQTLNDLGAVLHQLRRFDEAIEAFSRAIALSPADPQAHVNRGWTFEAAGKLAEATADFDASRRLAPDNAEAIVGLGYLLASTAKIADAQTYASLALLEGSNDYLILHNVACIYGRLSALDAPRRVEHEDTALLILGKAMELWRSSRSGSGSGRPSEPDLIRSETAFPAGMRSRDSFKALLESSQGRACATNARVADSL